MPGIAGAFYVRAEIAEEASVSLRGIGGAGCWERVEMTNGLLCN